MGDARAARSFTSPANPERPHQTGARLGQGAADLARSQNCGYSPRTLTLPTRRTLYGFRGISACGLASVRGWGPITVDPTDLATLCRAPDKLLTSPCRSIGSHRPQLTIHGTPSSPCHRDGGGSRLRRRRRRQPGSADLVRQGLSYFDDPAVGHARTEVGRDTRPRPRGTSHHVGRDPSVARSGVGYGRRGPFPDQQVGARASGGQEGLASIDHQTDWWGRLIKRRTTLALILIVAGGVIPPQDYD